MFVIICVNVNCEKANNNRDGERKRDRERENTKEMSNWKWRSIRQTEKTKWHKMEWINVESKPWIGIQATNSQILLQTDFANVCEDMTFYWFTQRCKSALLFGWLFWNFHWSVVVVREDGQHAYSVHTKDTKTAQSKPIDKYKIANKKNLDCVSYGMKVVLNI